MRAVWTLSTVGASQPKMNWSMARRHRVHEEGMGCPWAQRGTTGIARPREMSQKSCCVRVEGESHARRAEPEGGHSHNAPKRRDQACSATWIHRDPATHPCAFPRLPRRMAPNPNGNPRACPCCPSRFPRRRKNTHKGPSSLFPRMHSWRALQGQTTHPSQAGEGGPRDVGRRARRAELRICRQIRHQ